MKLWAIIKSLLEKESIVFSSKSNKIIGAFTRATEELELMNNRIDEKIELSNRMISDIQMTQNELAATKEKNEKIKSKLESLITD